MNFDMMQRIGMGFVLAGLGALLQGCLATMWVAAVGAGSTVSSSVQFEPFENTWVAPAEAWMMPDGMHGVAVPPFTGDESMARRFSVAFQHVSSLRVVGPEQLGEHVTPAGAKDHPHLARAIASRANVDCVLFGIVVRDSVKTDRWGNKEVTSNRLTLTLVDAEGYLLWKDELPYRVIEGAQPFPEEWLQESLTNHLAAHAEAIGLMRVGIPARAEQA